MITQVSNDVACTRMVEVEAEELVIFWTNLEQEPTKFADELDVGCERIKNNQG